MADFEKLELFVNDDKKRHKEFIENDRERVASGEILITLKKMDMFDHLNKEQLFDIADIYQVKAFNQGDMIIEKGNLINYVYLIGKGHCDIYETSTSEKVIDRLYECHFIGALDLFKQRNGSAFVKASTPVSCGMIAADDFNRIIRPLIEELRRISEQYNRFTKAVV